LAAGAGAAPASVMTAASSGEASGSMDASVAAATESGTTVCSAGSGAVNGVVPGALTEQALKQHVNTRETARDARIRWAIVIMCTPFRVAASVEPC
jgi:hypothetical protein